MVHRDDVLSLFVTRVCVVLLVQNGWTSLLQASQEGHDKVARLLLQNGADVNAADKVCKSKIDGW